MSDPSQLIDSFIAITSSPRYLAEQFLAKNEYNIHAAIEEYYRTYGEGGDSEGAGESEFEEKAPRSSTSRLAPGGGVRTLRDLLESDDEQKTAQNFFTGGEKSALQVENPDKNDRKKRAGGLVDHIFQRAKDQLTEADDRPSAQAPSSDTPSSFTGTGFRLGDLEHSLEVIPDANATTSRPAKVSRQITFWREGFTVGDGPFRRYDDRENFQLLSELKQGRVPVSLLGVELGQDVDVTVIRKVDEDYVPPKASQGGFHGQGQRLGSPVPGETSIEPSPAPVSEPPKSSDNVPEKAPAGDTAVQIRFANGKRLSHRFNASDSISSVYEFVRSHPYNQDTSRGFILSHAFPVKAIEASETETVESANLKNAVIVQRWS